MAVTFVLLRVYWSVKPGEGDAAMPLAGVNVNNVSMDYFIRGERK